MESDLPVNYRNLNANERKVIRGKYIKVQGNKCYHCGTNLNGQPREDILNLKINKKYFPIGFFKWPVHLHHCHRTGMTLGAVHSHCNAVLWQYHGE